MEYQTWTRKANAVAAVQKLLKDVPMEYFIIGVDAHSVSAEGSEWSVTVEVDNPPSDADALQEILGDKARVKALRPELVPNEAWVAEMQSRPKLNFNDDKQHEIDSAHMVDEPATDEEIAEEGSPQTGVESDVDLEQLGEFGLGDNAMNAECPHCGIDHYGNGWQMHSDEHKCDDMLFACLACGGEWGPKIKRRASADRQPTLKGQRLSVVGGKDAANPFREGSKSHATFAMVQANPGKTYEELRDMGARMRTITHSTKQGWIRAL